MESSLGDLVLAATILARRLTRCAEVWLKKNDREVKSVPPKQRPVKISPKPCPRCGSEMRLRNGRNGPFYGCTQYPECKGSRNLKPSEIRALEESMPPPKSKPPVEDVEENEIPF